MDDLRQRFATLDRMPVPDLWNDVERRFEALEPLAPTRRLVAVWPEWRAPIGSAASRSAVASRRRRAAALLVMAALLAAALIGGAIAVGSGLVRLTSVVPPTASPDLSRVVAPPSASPLRLDSPRPSTPDATVLGSGAWTVTGRMKYGRLGETATLLPDGHVLVAGGFPEGEALSASAELYDPISGRWTEAGSMHARRGQGHSATLLPDGRVLVVGGDQITVGHPPQSSAELYDPATGTWTDTGSLLQTLSHHSAILLPDGKVLVAGGVSDSGNKLHASKKAELFDLATGTWTATGSMSVARATPSAALLPDGRVLVVGGSASAGAGLQSAELYDPLIGRWEPAPSFAGLGSCRIAAALLDGRVLAVCAEANGVRTSAALYDPASGAWATTESPPTACCLGEASPRGSIVRLPDGRVLWKDLIDAGELYDPATGTWDSAGGPTYPADQGWGLPFTSTDEGAGYYADTFTVLPDGRVLMTTLGAGLLYAPNSGR